MSCFGVHLSCIYLIVRPSRAQIRRKTLDLKEGVRSFYLDYIYSYV